jgi:hypothetical protein
LASRGAQTYESVEDGEVPAPGDVDFIEEENSAEAKVLRRVSEYLMNGRISVGNIMS